MVTCMECGSTIEHGNHMLGMEFVYGPVCLPCVESAERNAVGHIAYLQQKWHERATGAKDASSIYFTGGT